MSRIMSRKMNKTPVRSPSPDVAHSNIIGRTASPLTQALAKLRTSRTSKSPLGRGFSNSEEYEAYIRSLEEKIKQFSTENSILQHEVENKAKEIDFLKELNFKYRKEASSRSYSRHGSEPDTLRDYESKIRELSEEVKRVHDVLIKDRSTIDLLERENAELRNRNASRPTLHEEKKLTLTLLELERKLNDEFNRRLSEYQNKVQMVLEEEVKKINKVERDQRALARDAERKQRNYGSPAQGGREKDSFNSTSSQEPRSESQLRAECPNCRNYLLRIAELEGELNVKSFNAHTASKSIHRAVSASHLEEYLEKLEEIRMILNNQEIEESIAHIEHNLNDIFTIDEKFEYMKQQKNTIIQQLRDKEVQQALEIVKLKKENELFRQQTAQQQQEIDQLKELTSLKSPRSEDPTKRKKETNEGNILRRYIVEAIERIESLESQIGDTLRS